ncbi:MAG: hypothetical protein AB1689_04930 [Thermodesulfobacteriota bacterium]
MAAPRWPKTRIARGARAGGALVAALLLAACSGDGAGTGGGVSTPESVQPFSAVQEVFTQSCALSSCHSAVARQGGLVLDHEDVSYTGLVGHPAQHVDAQAQGLVRVVPGDPDASFLIRKLRGLGPGDKMPVGGSLPEDTVAMIERWIERGAHSTADECGEQEAASDTGLASVAHHPRESARCTGYTPPQNEGFTWQPLEPLPAPAPSEGLQLYVPPRDVEPGQEWEVCYAFTPDLSQLPTGAISRQEYRMHEGSHHLLLYSYFGEHPEQYASGFWPCLAANCVNPGDCPEDSDEFLLPIGGTQVAGTHYVVEYPKGVGLPLLGRKPVIIANLHYTNTFQPAQRIYGEAWLNLYFHRPEEFKVVLDGIFAINSRDLIVEPYETKTISRVWNPRSILTRQPANAAIFQLFGHMHKRGRLFTIEFVDGESATEIYRTTAWDLAPVQDYEPPYLRVKQDQGLRWTCTHENGRRDDPNYPPKKCHEGCAACGWDDATRTCTFTRDDSNRVYAEGEPMPLVFGLLADDDMCNMFGYFIREEDLTKLE